MAHELKLRKGNKSLIISAGRYGLGSDFVPPSTSWALNMSGSTSANRTGGSSVISRRAVNSDMGFTVYVNGSSKAEIDKGVRDLAAMIDMAGDPNEPLYLEWRANGDLPIPVWGQFGAPLRAEVVAGGVSRDGLYGVAALRGQSGRVGVSLMIKPYWLGNGQSVANADGGILEDRFGYYSDRRSRGLIVNGAVVNKMTNPVFGYDTDPDNGWTITTVLSEINQNPDYILFGDFSLKAIAADGTGRITQSIAAGNTNAHMLSCYAKLPDGGVISATQCALYYGAAKSTTYTSLGNGWYRLSGAVTGIAAATATGLQVESGYTVYADGFQLEEAATLSELAYGDLLGCSWATTRHGSATTRLVGYCRVNPSYAFENVLYSSAVMYPSHVSIAITWKTSVANTFATDQFLFDAGTFQCYYYAGNDRLYLEDGTSTVSAAMTFSAGEIIHLVIVAQPGELRIYKNGASVASDIAYDTTNWQTTGMYIGSDSTPANHAQGTIMGFTVYDAGLTAAQVLAIYNDAAPIIADKEIVDWIPYTWVYDLASGTGISGYHDATHKDYYVIDGIAGTLSADSWIYMSGSGTGAYLALNACDEYMDMSQSYDDCQGTAVAGAVGGEVDRSAAFTTAETTIPESGERIIIKHPPRNYEGKNLYVAAGILDNSTGLKAYLKCGNISGDTRTLVADTTERMFVLGPVTIPRMIINEINFFGAGGQTIALVCTRTGSNGTVDIDYYRCLIGRICYTLDDTLLHGNRAYKYIAGPALSDAANPRGDIIEFEPNKINYLVIAIGTDAEAITPTSEVWTMTVLKMTPRWSAV